MSNNDNSFKKDEIKDVSYPVVTEEKITKFLKSEFPKSTIASDSFEGTGFKASSKIPDDCCSYLVTKNKHTCQEWANCNDCFKSSNQGACLFCLESCHKGHRIGPIRLRTFFCDCECCPKEEEQVKWIKLG